MKTKGYLYIKYESDKEKTHNKEINYVDFLMTPIETFLNVLEKTNLSGMKILYCDHPNIFSETKSIKMPIIRVEFLSSLEENENIGCEPVIIKHLLSNVQNGRNFFIKKVGSTNYKVKSDIFYSNDMFVTK